MLARSLPNVTAFASVVPGLSREGEWFYAEPRGHGFEPELSAPCNSGELGGGKRSFELLPHLL